MIRILAGLALFLLLSDGSILHAGPVRIGDIAPDFNLVDVTGRSRSLHDFRGKPVVISFWATWCGYCVDEFEEFAKLQDTLRGRVELVSINLGESSETVAHFLADRDFRWNFLLDSEGTTGAAYQVNSLPTTVFVSPDGVVVDRTVGSLETNVLISKIESAGWDRGTGRRGFTDFGVLLGAAARAGLPVTDVRVFPSGATFTYRKLPRPMDVLIRERDFPSGSSGRSADPLESRMIEIQIPSFDLDTFPVDMLACELLSRNSEHPAGAWVFDRGQNRLALAEKVMLGKLDPASLQWICDRMVATVAELDDMMTPDPEAR